MVTKINHDSNAKEMFGTCAKTIVSSYWAVTIPFRIAFLSEFRIKSMNWIAFTILDLVALLLSLIDTVRYYNHHRLDYIAGKVNRISPESFIVAKNQSSENSSSGNERDIAGSFLADGASFQSTKIELLFSFLGCIPLEYLSLIWKSMERVTIFLLLNRILLIYRLPKYTEELFTVMEEKKIVRSIGVQRAFKLFFTMALVGHWCCCGFFFVSKSEMAIGTELSWVQDLDLLTMNMESTSEHSHNQIELRLDVPVHHAYIYSLYWAYITMVTTGFGDIVPLTVSETLWCIFSMFIGVIVTTCAIANLQLVVTNADAAFTEFQQKLETINRYMRYRRLPDDLQSRILTFYRYQWDTLKGVDEEKIMNDLPTSLQQQVANFMCRDLIASLPLLRGANTSLLNALADFTHVNIYSPKDIILKDGDFMKGAIIVSIGEVDILKKDLVERKMKRPDHFGTESLFTPKQSDRTIQSHTFSEVFYLPSDLFLQAIHSQCDSTQIKKMEDMALLAMKSESKVNKLFGSGIDTNALSRFQRQLHPQSGFRFTWDIMILMGLIFYSFSIPLFLMIFFDSTTKYGSFTHFFLSYLVDAFFVIDTYLSFNKFMFYEEGLVITDHLRIRQKYLADHNCYRELISLLPVDFLCIFATRRSQYLFRLTKMLRLKNLPKSLRAFDRAISDWKFDGSLTLLRVVKLNIALLITCHWVGCLWHCCASIGHQLGYDDTWLLADELDSSLSIDHSIFGTFGPYLRSFYWAMVGMSTVGYGDIVPVNIIETAFAAIIILFGGLILPAIVGGLAAYLGNLNVAERSYRKKISRVKQYLRHRSVRKPIIDRVVSYYEYLWSHQGSIDEEEIMNELPLPLRQSVAIHVNQCHISSYLFNYCDDSTRVAIALNLKPRIFLPTDRIIQEGEVGTCMFFIERGEVSIISSESECLVLLDSGMCFGESALMISTLHSYSAIALTFCDTFELAKDDFHQILSASSTRDEILRHIGLTIRQKTMMYHNILNNLKKTSTFIRAHRESRAVSKNNKVYFEKRALISPDSVIRVFWNVIVLSIIIYNCLMVPFYLSFGVDRSQLMLDYIFDALLVCDMILNFKVFAIRLEGELVCDPHRVKRMYIQKKFRNDAVATIPYDIFYFLFSPSKSYNAVLIALFRIPKLIWMLRLPEILNSIFRVFEGTDISLSPLKLFEFLTGVLLIAHWAACGFYAFAKWKIGVVHPSESIHILESANMNNWRGTWVQRQIVNGKLPWDGGKPWQQYIRAFNWALPTLVAVVIGDVVPINMHETVYALLWMIIGVSVNSAIIGNVANIVANIDSESSLFAKSAEEVKRLMITSKVSIYLQSRIESFVSALWSHRDAAEQDSFVSKLPVTLQIQVTEHTRQWHISHCPFFDFCSFDIVKTLSLRLKSALYCSGDIIVHYGDMGHEMFFLERGTVEVLAENDYTVFATLTADNDCGTRMPVFFGETSLFFKRQRQNTVRAITFCEVYTLRKEDLDLELLQRDFDTSRMLDVFTSIADSNLRRNNAVAANLKLCQDSTSKLSRLIDPIPSPSTLTPVHTLFLPNSRFRICWDVACLFFGIYSATEIPFHAVYLTLKPVSQYKFLTVLNLLIDVFFMTECYLRYKLFLFTKNGKTISDPDKIKKEYKRNGLWVDAFANTPLSVLVIVLGWNKLSILRFIHVIRTVRLPVYFERIEGYLIIVKFRIGAATKLLVRILLLYVLAIHWFACSWFAIHRFIEHNVKYTWATTDCPAGQPEATEGCLSSWIDSDNNHDICYNDMIFKCYIRSIYFVLTTMSSVGYGDISPVTEFETIFENIVILTGASFLAGMIGAFGEYFAYSDQSGSSAFKVKLQKLTDYLSYRQIPLPVRDSIVFFYKSRWNKTRVLNQKVATALLSEPLQMDLSFESSIQVIQKFPILTECSRILIKRICHSFNIHICPPNTPIYKAGDIGFDIYFIGAGLVKITLPRDLSILDEDGRANAAKAQEKAAAIGSLYRPGNHFGESCLDSSSGVRQETAETKTIVELYVLAKSQLELILHYIPPRERLQFLRNIRCRNGNVRHGFESLSLSNDEGKSKIDRNSMTSQTSFLSWSKPRKHFSLASLKSPSSTEMDSVMGSRKNRLLSFSAQAIQARKLRAGSEFHDPSVAAIKIQSLVEEGKVAICQESRDSSSEYD